MKTPLSLPVGEPIEDWKEALLPSQKELKGNFCFLQSLEPERDAPELFQAFQLDKENQNWTYLPYGPFANYSLFWDWLKQVSQTPDIYFYTIREKTKKQAIGMASYLRLNPKDGVIEVGHIHFSKLLQKSTAATESMYLMMKHAFEELGYRRYEWKCDSLNESSKKAAIRLGFQFEGIFRQLTIYKNRNRDTAWFSIIDKEWQELKTRFEKWLNPNNFDKNGLQKRSLRTF